MELLDHVPVNVLEVVSDPCTDDRVSFPLLTVSTEHDCSRVEQCIKRTQNQVEGIPEYLLILDLLFCHGSCFSMSFEVIFRRNGKNGNKDVCKIQRL